MSLFLLETPNNSTVLILKTFVVTKNIIMLSKNRLINFENFNDFGEILLKIYNYLFNSDHKKNFVNKILLIC